MKFLKSRLFIAILVFATIAVIYFSEALSYFSLETIQLNLEALKTKTQENLILAIGVYFLIYVIVTALSVPGATLLTLLAGALFGTFLGFILASLASTLGATLAFLGTRYLFRNWVEEKFQEKLKMIDRGIHRDGVFYLLSLRLAPVVPFVLVNMLMGLTQMSVFRYFVISQVGMIPGTLAYVYAGRELGQLTTISGVFSPSFILALFGLALLPWAARFVLNQFKFRRLYKAFKKPKKYDYNLIVIGAGAGGLVASYIAALLKAKVALVEKHKMGGDCLNYGCVPSKALIKSARVAHTIKQGEKFGIKSESSQVDFSFVKERLKKVIREIEPHDSTERYKSLGVDCYIDTAKILSPFEVQIGEKIFSTKAIVLATGARPVVPPLPGIQLINALTSETLWEMKELPKNLLILGGGAIGCELAQSFQRLGSQVTLVDRSDHLMSRMDNDVSEFIEARLCQEGVNIKVSTEVLEFNKNQAVVRKNGKSEIIDFDQVIFALGRKARVEGFGLEELGIKTNEFGFIEHNDFLATQYPNIFVCGDCAGPYQLTHVAAHQAWYASINSLFAPFKKFKEDLRVIPSVIFTDPEVSSAGLTEKEALAQNLRFDVTKYNIADLDRAICEGENEGFVKILTAQGSDQILGATIVSAHSGEFISEIVFAMKHKMGLGKILSTIHSYPTWAESNKFVAGQWRAKNAPQGLLKIVEFFHRWRRS